MGYKLVIDIEDEVRELIDSGVPENIAASMALWLTEDPDDHDLAAMDYSVLEWGLLQEREEDKATRRANEEVAKRLKEGGKKGAKITNSKLTKEQLSQKMSKAAAARWAEKRKDSLLTTPKTLK
jgi:hypothetical protein